MQKYPDWFMPIFNAVSKTDVAEQMRNTVEDSPWHREANTWVHTCMTLETYFNTYANMRTPRQQLLTAIALIFHDFGKPSAEETLTSEDGSTRRRYAGHELISANSFIDFICSNEDVMHIMVEMGITMNDVRVIRFMIEHHLPYGLKKQNKLESLKFNLATMLGDDMVCFYDMLLSDSRGRISDDHAAKLEAVDEWITGFKQIPVGKATSINALNPTVIITLGASGSGKSTWSNNVAKDSNILIFSLDNERVKFAESLATEKERQWMRELEEVDPKGFYDVMFNLSIDDNKAKFKAFANANYIEMLRSRKNIIVDNMNVSKKGRAFFITEARRQGYDIMSAEFIVPLQTVIDRQKTRDGKDVPKFAVERAYLAQQLPLLSHASVNLKTGKDVINDYGEVDAYIQIKSF